MNSSLRTKPGTILSQYLAKKGIRKREGCGCVEVAREMDLRGADDVLNRLDYYTEEMVRSSGEWITSSGAPWAARFSNTKLARFAIRNLIKWAANESIIQAT